MLDKNDVLSTVQMIDRQHLDIRTITMGISLLSCADRDAKAACEKIYDKITRYAEGLVKTGEDIEREFGIPIVNKRISVTPIALVAAASETEDYVPFAVALDRAAKAVGVNFIGGFSALVQKGMTDADRRLIAAIPEALAVTDLVCSSVNVGSTKAGINMDAVALMGRTITMGISLLSCADRDAKAACEKIYDKITRYAEGLVKTGEDIEREFGIPIVNKRISVTPIALVAAASETEDYVPFAVALDRAAKAVGVNFIGGFSALVQKGMTDADRRLIAAIPEALAVTDLVCSSVNVGSTKAGINMDAVALMGRTVKAAAERTADCGGFGCAKLVVFCNAVEDNPFMAGAFHGVGEPERVINVGVSGPGVVYHALQSVKGQPFDVVAETVKKTAFRITRMGQLVAQEASRRLNTPFGIVDLSLAPTPAVGDSVARILEEMGLEVCGTHGTTAALALLNDAVKKGGVMASSSVGGLSGAFIPVSEDEGMIAAASSGALTLDKLEAMTCVCSVGLDMIAVPGDTSAETIAAIIADEAAIGMVNTKTTAVRIIPAPGCRVGDTVEFGGLLGSAPVQAVHPYSSADFIARGGRIPAPLHSLKN